VEANTSVDAANEVDRTKHNCYWQLFFYPDIFLPCGHSSGIPNKWYFRT